MGENDCHGHATYFRQLCYILKHRTAHAEREYQEEEHRVGHSRVLALEERPLKRRRVFYEDVRKDDMEELKKFFTFAAYKTYRRLV